MMGLLLVLILNVSSLPACVVAQTPAINDETSVSAVARHGVRSSVPQAVSHRTVTSLSAFPLKFVPTPTEVLPTPHAIASLDGEPLRRDVSPPTSPSSLALGLFHPLRC